ncbi:MAG: manganese efflux pump [Lachnospiraceae bacterium]|nr:manganese efflux pump [Candidatus Merdinaster equi]
MDFVFILNSILLGVGLAMDAFSVSLANGLADPKMRFGKMSGIAGCFAFFQWFMPMIGWVCVHTILQYFGFFEKFIPWIALLLLLFIGGKMLIEGIKGGEEEASKVRLTFGVLMVQGIATSIDALSVGFTISEYDLVLALVSTIIIAITTFAICIIGLIIGKVVGTKLAGKAQILGGIVLIIIGLEIWIKGVFF